MRGGEKRRGDAAGAVCVLALAAAVLFVELGERPLYAPDEGRYAAIALEMVSSGDWIVPRLSGVPYLDKPPLLYWLEAAGIAAFGPNEWGARALPALVSWLGVLLTLRLGRLLYDDETGVVAGGILASTALWVGVGRSLLTDGVLSVCLLGAFLCFARVRAGRAGGLGIWLCLAAATLAKGPVAVVLFAGSIGGWWLLGERPPLRRLRPVAGPVLYLLVALPWFVAIERAIPGAVGYFALNQNLAALTERGIHHAAPWYLSLPMLAGGFAPWSALLLLALPAVAGWARAPRSISRSGALLACWCLAVFGLFTLSVSKLATYFLPMYPALAILVARLFLRESSRRSAALLLAVLGAAIPLAGLLLLDRFFEAPRWLPFGAALLALGGGLLAAAALRASGRARAAALAVVAGLALAIAPASNGLETTATRRAPRALLQGNAELLAACDPLLAAHFPVGMIEFYLQRQPVILGRARAYAAGRALAPEAGEFLANEEFGRFVAAHPRICVLAEEKVAKLLLADYAALELASNATGNAVLRVKPDQPGEQARR